jgi:hypothetical protein
MRLLGRSEGKHRDITQSCGDIGAKEKAGIAPLSGRVVAINDCVYRFGDGVSPHDLLDKESRHSGGSSMRVRRHGVRRGLLV